MSEKLKQWLKLWLPDKNPSGSRVKKEVRLVGQITIFGVLLSIVLPLVHLINVADWITGLNFFIMGDYLMYKFQQKTKLNVIFCLIFGVIISVVVSLALLLYGGLVTGR